MKRYLPYFLTASIAVISICLVYTFMYYFKSLGSQLEYISFSRLFLSISLIASFLGFLTAGEFGKVGLLTGKVHVFILGPFLLFDLSDAFVFMSFAEAPDMPDGISWGRLLTGMGLFWIGGTVLVWRDVFWHSVRRSNFVLITIKVFALIVLPVLMLGLMYISHLLLLGFAMNSPPIPWWLDWLR